mgnify:CR=1 FL=1
MQANLYDGCTMGDLIQRAIERGGDRVAFILDDQKITYREFGSLLSRFIQALAERGVRKGDAIAALSSNRPEAFMASAAAFVMGLRITWMHPLGSEDDHAYLLEDSGVTTLLVDPETLIVWVDEAKIPNREVDGWTYSPGDNAVVFHGRAVPRAGMTVYVEYRVLTGGGEAPAEEATP